MYSDHCAYTASPSLIPSVDPPPSGVSGGVIAGVVIGVVVVVVIIILAVVAVLMIVIYQRQRGMCVLSVPYYFHLLLSCIRILWRVTAFKQARIGSS